MAASIWRVGRVGALKFLHIETWGFKRTAPSAALCSKSQEPKKAAKKKAMAPPAKEPEFDNMTYKNLQHHEYTPFTFVDYDVELAKYRLPQPSAGRISPRH